MQSQELKGNKCMNIDQNFPCFLVASSCFTRLVTSLSYPTSQVQSVWKSVTNQKFRTKTTEGSKDSKEFQADTDTGESSHPGPQNCLHHRLERRGPRRLLHRHRPDVCRPPPRPARREWMRSVRCRSAAAAGFLLYISPSEFETS